MQTDLITFGAFSVLVDYRSLHVAGSANDVIGAKAADITCYWSNRDDDCVGLPGYVPDHQGHDLASILDAV